MKTGHLRALSTLPGKYNACGFVGTSRGAKGNLPFRWPLCVANQITSVERLPYAKRREGRKPFDNRWLQYSSSGRFVHHSRYEQN
jgi:hypothetical protein